MGLALKHLGNALTLILYLNCVFVAVAVIESTPSYTDVEDEDIEEEFKNLELEVGSENLQVPTSQTGVDSAVEVEALESADSLSDALSNLKLTGNTNRESASKNPMLAMRQNKSKKLELEAT